MAIKLYDLTVPRYRQTIDALVGVVDKAIAHCESGKVDPSILVEARLFHDMLAFKDQVAQVIRMSVDAIEGAKAGTFSASLGAAPATLAEMKAALANASAKLGALDPAQINALEQKDVAFSVPQRNMNLPFTALGFLTSLALPNFYFHATTAYDILRHKGVPLGKMDFLGKLQLRM